MDGWMDAGGSDFLSVCRKTTRQGIPGYLAILM